MAKPESAFAAETNFMSNLVLTSVYGLSAEKVEPFLYSLRHCGCTDDLVVFANQISPECRAMLLQYQARLVEFESFGSQLAYAGLAERLASIPRAAYRAYVQHRRDVRCLIINCWRFFGFFEYLNQLQNKPDYVLLSDIRDVVFQANPFVFSPGLSVASECVRGTIRSSPGNSKWLWEAAGFLELIKLGKCTPVCAGTTAADYPSMIKYLAFMTEQLRKRYFWGLFDGVDQGLHNYLVYNRLVQPLHLQTNWNGPFLTLDSETVSPRNKTKDGYLCNEDGSVIPIVHQYDRIKDLFQKGKPRPPCWKFYTS